jgi:hypothetical protein
VGTIRTRAKVNPPTKLQFGHWDILFVNKYGSFLKMWKISKVTVFARENRHFQEFFAFFKSYEYSKEKQGKPVYPAFSP